jgi:hypothetical protein
MKHVEVTHNEVVAVHPSKWISAIFVVESIYAKGYRRDLILFNVSPM